ncbi:MAG: polysaccharide deacetylase family protein [Eubacteriales bacterium]|nr:polysaccharide deacetylase family protein [Eubacteriales bacterium]
MKRLLALTLALLLALSAWPALAETLQDCHRVTMTKADTTQANKSVIRLWTADTVLDTVDEELAAIAQDYVDKYAPTLKKAANTTSSNSRLDVGIRYSRTGLTWMSFLVQARVTYHRDLIGQEITSRTYDMTTGERIWLSDIFPVDSPAWAYLEDKVRQTVTGYFPDEEPDYNAVEALCSRGAIEEMDFTLHGMSLVLHIPAETLYPEHFSLMEVTVFYPEIYDWMTERAFAETDNLSYYKTCALTFDDGPNRTNTTKVLNNLMETGSVATFFVVGTRINDFTDLIQREHDEGHAIGSHNWSHADVRKVSGTSLRAMPAKVDARMIEAIGIPVRYNRVPYGLYPQMISAKVGWPLIQWSVDTYDWRGRSTTTVVGTVKDQLADGDIILCHDIKDNTPESAKRIATTVAEKGYMMLTIDELMAKDGVELKPDTVYYRCSDGDYSIKKRD